MWRSAAVTILILAAATVSARPASALPLPGDERVVADASVVCADPLFTDEAVAPIVALAAGRRVTAAVYDTRRRCWHHLAPGLRITTASVIKAEILAGVVLQARRHGRHLTPWERERVRRMIRYSHNSPPTSELLAHIGGVAGMQRLDAEFGATATTQTSVYGAVWTTAVDRTRITAGLLWGGGPVDATGRALAASYMDDVHPTQTWGVTAGVPAGYRVALKNGFYPMQGYGWRVGSTGLVRTPDGEGYVVTVMTDGNADQESGVAVVEAVSRIVADGLLDGPPTGRAVDDAVCVTIRAGQPWPDVATALGLPAARWADVRDVSGGDATPLGGQRACSPDLGRRPVESCVSSRTRPSARADDGYVVLGSTGVLDSWGVPLAATAGCRPGTAVDVTVDGTGGWRVLTTAGSVIAGGGAAHLGDGPTGEWVAMATTGGGDGYRLAATDGTVRAFGTADHLGDKSGIDLAAPVVDLVATPNGDGYWLVSADGGVFTFGDSRFHGSTSGITLDQQIVGMAPTPTGRGYWLAAADGGVFAFGDARFHGSTGGITLDQPITAIVGSAAGYVLVGRDGGVFAFGDATYLGGLGGTVTPWPVTAATRG